MDTTRINLTRHSKYCTQFICYKKGGLIEELLILGKDGKYQDWLLLPTNDAEVEILGKNKDELSKYFKISTANFDILKYFFNKRLTYKLAQELHIDIPETWMPDNFRELEKMNIQFPCIIKPAVMHTFYNKTKKKVFVCNNFKELIENYNSAIRLIPSEEVIVQDIIPGDSENQYSVCFMFDGTIPLVTLGARRARQHPPDFGNATTFAETVYIPEIIASAVKILAAVNYSGVCEVEFKFDKRDNKYKFLEVNPRTWKWHSIAEKSGSPILMSLFHFTYNLTPIIKNTYEKAFFRHLMTDIPTLIQMKKFGLFNIKSDRKIKYAVWELNDIKPGFFELFYLFYFILKR